MAVKVLVIVCVLALFASSVLAAGTRGNLLSLIQVYRHGERAPVSFYPTDPYQDFKYWNTTEGQLTNRGKRQHFELGQYTRARYGNFIPKNYSNENFLVQSTSVDRTLMSAASNLAGLYPPVGYQEWLSDFRWQPIPIFQAEEAVIGSFQGCPAYNEQLTQVLTTNEYFTNIQAENQEIIPYLSKHSGMNITSILEAYSIWDALHIENLQGFALPEWTNAVFPEPLTTLGTLLFLGSSYTEELKVITTGPFFNELIQHFEAISEDPSSVQKHRQFSGHDINIACLLNSLGAYNPVHAPGFASTIYFELREGPRQNYINMYYSNSAGAPPEPISLAGCGFNCNLRDFKNILRNRTITPDEWNELCNA
ncbi:hypothetical protein NQ315_008561 [Exocentrus adspersus]|uniref:acid phosphatase n=1 Tax=Exocentrus adspersus TaxID=1586481 RepID=A0AAV8W6H0_9CUCU|nr:hypothetical protein NQ315_008561 [Exocentrus adspersus]